jgi:hypothetical protein
MPSRQGRRGGSAVVLVLGGLVLLGCLGASPTAALAVQAAPDLRPAAATIHPPAPAYVGDIVEVSVVIVNQGDATATAASIDLVDARPGGGAPVPIGGSVTLTAPLGAGASVTLSMPPFIAAGVGMHTLTIRVGNVTPAEVQPGGGAISIPLEVLPARTSAPPPPPSDGIHIEGLESFGLGALLGFAVVILGIGVAVAAVGRRSRELEPPPHEPPDRSPPPLWPP